LQENSNFIDDPGKDHIHKKEIKPEKKGGQDHHKSRAIDFHL
jgi:hypothetical protein